MVNKFLFEGNMAQGPNGTNIYLIPKTDKLQEMVQLGLISLCNVSYKIISTFLCQRLKKVLSGHISETQQSLLLGDRLQIKSRLLQKCFMHSEQNHVGGPKEWDKD